MSLSGIRLRVVIVTNIPAPYRLPIYALLDRHAAIDLHVVYCSGREPDRAWNLAEARFAHTYLHERMVTYKGRFIHFNDDIWAVLDGLRPDVVITTGFNPTHLLAYAWSRLRGAAHVPMTDGTLESEAQLTPLHRWIRRRVYARSAAFIAASEGGRRLYRAYGIPDGDIRKSHLCADNARFFAEADVPKRYDFVFCGRFVAIKNPVFALEMARDVAGQLGRRVSIVLVGSGRLEAEMRAFAESVADRVEATFAGFASQEALPRWYGAARVFLFPTSWDPWGVVANEACAAGVPVLVSESAGVAGELVRDGENGYVLPLDKARWVEAGVRLLNDDALRAAMGARGRERVAEYSYENAARGIAEAAVAADRARPAWGSRRPVSRPRVLVVQRRLTHYRVPLFNRMRELLDAAGVELVVAYGDPTREEFVKADAGELPWGVHIPTRYWLGGRLCWQNALPAARHADLVVVTQENRLLFNYLWALVRGDRKWAFWGHGRNFQTDSPTGFRERFKRWLSTRVDWWFAYTARSQEVILESGYPGERITVLNNAIDTGRLAAELENIGADDLEQARQAFGIGPGRVCLSLASLHADKRLDFLFEAAQRIRARVPDFRLVLVGDGPQRDFVARTVAEHPDWMTWLGARTGRDKALALAMSDLLLNPGMVGLSILDAFVAGVPMVTTAHQLHSPEIAYLQSGINGLMTEDSPDAFVDGVVGLLSDSAALAALREGCRVSAQDYSIENMADRFCRGILACLSGRDAAAD
ncbi:MAG TPA: glycosyltransferase family 4 protein [Thiobacillaceae bacterium]|nr:glycosyltransferase family 4 protein [Thiobacillaceae bacterium]